MGEKMIIEYRNNWCGHEYTVDGELVHQKRVRLIPQDLEYSVAAKNESGTYSDMGRMCGYSTVQYYITQETPVGTFYKSLMSLIKDGKVVELLE